jgi:hypothetical protein
VRHGVLLSFASEYDLYSKEGNEHAEGVHVDFARSDVKAHGELAVPAILSFGGCLLTRSASQVE